MKSQTLKENRDFRRLYYRGKNIASSCVVVYAMKRKYGKCRIGITSSKKIGNAVKRNRARRVIRAAYTELEKDIKGSWDFVFVARTKTTKVKMQEVLHQMRHQLIEIGAITDEKD